MAEIMTNINRNITPAGFSRLPRELLYSDLPMEAKLLYCILLDRGAVSERNRRRDQWGIYIYCTLETVQRVLSIGKDKAQRAFRTLEERQLILRRRRCGKPSRIYLLQPDFSTGDDRKPTPTPAENPPTVDPEPTNRYSNTNYSSGKKSESEIQAVHPSPTKAMDEAAIRIFKEKLAMGYFTRLHSKGESQQALDEELKRRLNGL